MAIDKLGDLGFDGSERTVRRAVAEVKLNHRRGQRRVFRPWLPEPGMWAQWDWGDGPDVAGRRTVLFCAWLAWSRFRVTIPCWDRTMPTLISCLDRAMRAFGGCPTYWLTDNEKTVTVEHVAGIAVRNPRLLEATSHYGVTVATCVAYDPGEQRLHTRPEVGRGARRDQVAVDHAGLVHSGLSSRLELTWRVDAAPHDGALPPLVKPRSTDGGGWRRPHIRVKGLLSRDDGGV